MSESASGTFLGWPRVCRGLGVHGTSDRADPSPPLAGPARSVSHARVGRPRRTSRVETYRAALHLAKHPETAASAAGLHYVSDEHPGLTRQKVGRGFRYLGVHGRPVRDAATLGRIRSLVIPPAWTKVWICPDALGHIQATGRDARGRKQYRYHPRWRVVRDEAKYGRMLAFGQALPIIRARTDEDLARPGLSRRKVLAAVIRLLEATLIRVGNEEYARDNGSFGLTTLRDRHALVTGSTVRFRFRGKSGKVHEIGVQDRAPEPDREALPGSARPGAVPVRGRPRPAPRGHVERRERLPARDHGPGVHGQGLPHLGGHRPRRLGARERASAAGRATAPGGDQAQRGARGGEGGQPARQHRRRLPEVLRPPRRVRRLPRRHAHRHAAAAAGARGEGGGGPSPARGDGRARAAAPAARSGSGGSPPTGPAA